jgi:hypothetical protein
MMQDVCKHAIINAATTARFILTPFVTHPGAKPMLTLRLTSNAEMLKGEDELRGLLRVEAAAIVFAFDVDGLAHLEEARAQAYADFILRSLRLP